MVELEGWKNRTRHALGRQNTERFLKDKKVTWSVPVIDGVMLKEVQLICQSLVARFNRQRN
ncbi:hypothetical protein PN36_08010 [Candidatus Thiomargarita nelsonii]|uniref:Uncharacterized protein n=1 Tax=Candidatus Thiomargarita nelsonii TaxID=1003181 RepID=A0A4E0QQY4_9GAMM|nr:hypothetical protein PN36_08010 [Candidatus Thiomargarita nelsonii]